MTKHSLKGLDRVEWHYIRYRHYAGSKKTVSLKAVEQVLFDLAFYPIGNNTETVSYASVTLLIQAIRDRQIQKRVDHYVKIK